MNAIPLNKYICRLIKTKWMNEMLHKRKDDIFDDKIWAFILFSSSSSFWSIFYLRFNQVLRKLWIHNSFHTFCYLLPNSINSILICTHLFRTNPHSIISFWIFFPHLSQYHFDRLFAFNMRKCLKDRHVTQLTSIHPSFQPASIFILSIDWSTNSKFPTRFSVR